VARQGITADGDESRIPDAIHDREIFPNIVALFEPSEGHDFDWLKSATPFKFAAFKSVSATEIHSSAFAIFFDPHRHTLTPEKSFESTHKCHYLAPKRRRKALAKKTN
jgi:hypothetical protein